MSKGLAVIYDRASSKKQEENYTRYDVKRIGAELAKRFSYEIESEPRYETKSGEELRNRPVMLGILKDIEEGKTKEGMRIAAIIVPNFTRLSRDEDIIDGLVIKKTCSDHQVVVIDFKGKVYDFRNDNDQDTAFLEFWFASRDKRQMMSNLMRGLKEKARQGEFMGGGAQLGYRLIPSGKTNRRGVPLKKKLIDPVEAEPVRKIFYLYYDLGAKKIASTLNSQGVYLPVRRPNMLKNEKVNSRPFTANDIMRIVTNPIYAGWVRWGTGVNKQRTQSKYLNDLEPNGFSKNDIICLHAQLVLVTRLATFSSALAVGIPCREVHGIGPRLRSICDTFIVARRMTRILLFVLPLRHSGPIRLRVASFLSSSSLYKIKCV